MNKTSPSVLVLTRTTGGGAGKAAERFHKNLVKHGLTSQFVTAEAVQGTNRIRRNIWKLQDYLFRKSAKPDPDYYFFDTGYYFANAKDIRAAVKTPPNIIVLFWMSGFLSMQSVLDLQRKYNAKVYWYPVDMGPLTSGCHYAWECKSYIKQCGFCPALGRKQENDRSRQTWQRKHAALEAMDISIITPATQIDQQVRESSLFAGKSITRIPFGVDETKYTAGNRAALREKLGIPEDSFLIFSGAASLEERRKGFRLLLEGLKHANSLGMTKAFFLTAGHVAGVENDIAATCIAYKHVPYIKDDKSLIELYQAADVTIVPSIEDTSPLMVIESLMCATPVIAYPTGIARDAVIDNATGYLADYANGQSLGAKIFQYSQLSAEAKTRMNENSREKALEMFALSAQFKRFKDLITSDDFNL